MIGAYKLSKLLAEREVERRISEDGLGVVIVAPSTPIGPRDIKPTPTGRIIVEMANGKMPAFLDTGLNLVHVDDVAEGHLLALEKGRIGENYILGGTDVTLQVMLADIGALVGRKLARQSNCHAAPCSRWPMRRRAWARLTGKEPFLTADALRMSRYPMFFFLGKSETRTWVYGTAIRAGPAGCAHLVRR